MHQDIQPYVIPFNEKRSYDCHLRITALNKVI